MAGSGAGPTRTYRGRTAVLTTRHGKERAIAPALAETAGLRVTVAAEVDTDLLGTFTGEVERPGPTHEVAVAKARLGMEVTGVRLGLASEGSFGPHPDAPFLSVGLELLVLVDDEAGLVIAEELFADRTNARHLDVVGAMPPATWLAAVGFPEHALIVRPLDGATPGPIAKGVAGDAHLREAIDRAAAASPTGRVRVETDLRADRNPTRMQAIAQVADRLGRRLATPCPGCTAPGYGSVSPIVGLLCAWCGYPTELTLALNVRCPSCGYAELRPRPDGRTSADPGRCPRCNP